MVKNFFISTLFSLFCFITTASADTVTPVARIVLLQGSVSAANDGVSRTLGRNNPLYAGDTITTGTRALAQIVFKDGGKMTINAESSLRIQDFVWNGAEDGTERAYFELVSGGFRAASGKIGHQHPELYKVHTPHADVGINGTYYGLLLCASGSCANAGNDLHNGLYGGAISGSINTTNTTGTQQHAEDTFFVVDNSAATPESVLVPPPIFHGGTTVIGDVAVADNTQHDDMQNVSIPSPPPTQGGDTGGGDTGGGTPPPVDPIVTDNDTVKADLNAQTAAPDDSTLLLSYTRMTVKEPGGNVVPNGASARVDQTASTNDSIALTSNQAVGGYSNTYVASLNNVLSGGTSSLSNTGSNSTYGAHWGVWNGDYLIMNNEIQETHDSHLNFIYSNQITTPTALSNLGGINSKLVMYRVIDGTLPINFNGIVSVRLPNIMVSVDFVAQRLTEYSLYIENLGGLDYWALLTAPVDFTDLNQQFSLSEPGRACAGGTAPCGGVATLAFVGANAEAAISSYSVYDAEPEATGSLSGSVLLQQTGADSSIALAADGTALLISNLGTESTGAHFPSTSAFITGSTTNTAIYLSTSNDAPLAATQQPTAQGLTISMVVNTARSGLADAGGVTTVNAETNNVQWGRWQGETQYSYVDRNDFNFAQLYFITSDNITPAATLSNLGGILGTQTYNSTGGTSLVDTAGSTIGNASISMTANFVSQEITSYALTDTQSGNGFSLNTTGGNAVSFSNINDGFALSSSGACLGGASCTGEARVQFVGTQAQGAITSYSILSDTDEHATGVSLLTR